MITPSQIFMDEFITKYASLLPNNHDSTNRIIGEQLHTQVFKQLNPISDHIKVELYFVIFPWRHNGRPTPPEEK